MVTLRVGAVKFRSLKQAFAAAQRSNPDLKWITWYMRHRMGANYQQAKRPVRKYNKRIDIQAAV